MQAPDETARRRQERKERFLREVNQPPPQPPAKKLAHPGGKIVTSDKERALLKLIARKQAAGEALSDDQRRALATLTANGTAQLAVSDGSSPLQQQQDRLPSPRVVSTVPSTSRAKPPAAARAPSGPPLSAANSKRAKTLRKKLHEIAELERRIADGGILLENQKAKVAAKADLSAELASIDPSSFCLEEEFGGCTSVGG
jgi:hypothetical protein